MGTCISRHSSKARSPNTSSVPSSASVPQHYSSVPASDCSAPTTALPNRTKHLKMPRFGGRKSDDRKELKTISLGSGSSGQKFGKKPKNLDQKKIPPNDVSREDVSGDRVVMATADDDKDSRSSLSSRSGDSVRLLDLSSTEQPRTVAGASKPSKSNRFGFRKIAPSDCVADSKIAAFQPPGSESAKSEGQFLVEKLNLAGSGGDGKFSENVVDPYNPDDSVEWRMIDDETQSSTAEDGDKNLADGESGLVEDGNGKGDGKAAKSNLARYIVATSGKHDSKLVGEKIDVSRDERDSLAFRSSRIVMPMAKDGMNRVQTGTMDCLADESTKIQSLAEKRGKVLAQSKIQTKSLAAGKKKKVPTATLR